jgi:catalase
VAVGLGMKKIPKISGPLNLGFPADANPKAWQPKPVNRAVEPSAALSILRSPNQPEPNIRTRKVAILVSEGSDVGDIDAMKKALMNEGAMPRLVGRHVGPFATTGGVMVAEFSILTASSVLFDAVYVPGGETAIAALQNEAAAIEFVQDAYKHYKPVAATGAGMKFFDAAGITAAKAHPEAGPDANPQAGVVTGKAMTRAIATGFIGAIAQHRHWNRGLKPPRPMPTA